MSYDFNTPGYALDRVKRFLAPPLTITPPPAEGVRFLRDVEVRVRDGTTLRVNVFRPEIEGRYPVIMCAHPYGKDNLPRRTALGYAPPFTYRIMRQSSPIKFSAWTGWEGPDPAYWVPRGYVLVNCDMRGFFRSDGEGSLLSDQEALDYHDLIEWAGTQPWSSGKVGLNGVSYLALSQWKVAALQPPHLAAIVPWEGFSDVYRDFARPGGIREDGFLPIWSFGVSRQKRCRTDMRSMQMNHPLRDDTWKSVTPALEKIQAPALICASFSDHNLHSRGCFRAFESISSVHKWLYTHRGGKWASYYSEEALAFQARFLDHFLKGEDNGMLDVPPVRLEVRESDQIIHQVRPEGAWPLASTRWLQLYLHPDRTLREQPPEPAQMTFDTRRDRASFNWTLERETEIVGPMKLVVQLQADIPDFNLFAGVRKLSGGQEVFFEGSFGFGRDMVTHGWLKASHRQLEADLCKPWEPVHTHHHSEPLQPGQVVTMELSLLPSATLFRGGEQLRLDLQGHWFSWRNPLLGHFPAGYEPSPPGTVTLHLREAYLMVPLTALKGESG